jgi:predicted  nucleic acid-binding Zn-ribbon protein
MADSMIAPAALAFEELERLVRHLGDELAFFRRRALEAERRLKEVAPPDGPGGERESVQALEARVARAESENVELRARLAEAADRTRGMADRMRFLRQQQEADGER